MFNCYIGVGVTVASAFVADGYNVVIVDGVVICDAGVDGHTYVTTYVGVDNCVCIVADVGVDILCSRLCSMRLFNRTFVYACVFMFVLLLICVVALVLLFTVRLRLCCMFDVFVRC